MHALIGYLVALAVFLGGGYAGVQWITAPQEGAAVDINRSVQPGKSSRAKLLARRKHEAEAERSANNGSSDAATSSREGVSTNTSEPTPTDSARADVEAEPMTIAAASPSLSQPKRVMTDTPVANPNLKSSDSPQAELTPVSPGLNAKAAAIAGAAAQATTMTMEAAPEGVVETLPSRAIVSVARARPRVALRDDDERRSARTPSAKPRDSKRISSSRKPVLMILRTVEYPDGRREQRLLPMPRYRQALADD